MAAAPPPRPRCEYIFITSCDNNLTKCICPDSKCICPNNQIYLFRLQNVLVQMAKCICPNIKMTLMTILREISRLTTKGKISEEDSRGASSALWGTKRGKRWGSWVGRGAQRWNGGAETIGRRVYKRAARPPRPQLRSHPASMTVTQVARKYLGKKFNFLKFCDKLLSFDWREVFPNQQPGKL